MANENPTGDNPRAEKWRTRVVLARHGDSRWTDLGDHGDPMLARIAGIAWVERALEHRSLDWVAPDGTIAIALWGDRPLATVTTTRV